MRSRRRRSPRRQRRCSPELFAELERAPTGRRHDARGRARHALRRPGAHAHDPVRPATARSRPAPTEIRDAVHADYERTFGHAMDEAVEIVSLRATLRTPLPRRAAEQRPSPRRTAARRRRRSRRTRSRAASGCRSRSSSAPLDRRRRARRARRSSSRRRRRPTSTPSSTARPRCRRLLEIATRGRLRCSRSRSSTAPEWAASAVRVDADPITTEVIRHGLNSAAEPDEARAHPHGVLAGHLRGARLRRRDLRPRVRLLAQAPSLPLFMGTMSFCVEAAVEAVGGEDALEPATSSSTTTRTAPARTRRTRRS